MEIKQLKYFIETARQETYDQKRMQENINVRTELSLCIPLSPSSPSTAWKAEIKERVEYTRIS